MNTVLDTLRFSEKLQSSGFAAQQADCLARALADELQEQLCTKGDVRDIRSAIDHLISRMNQMEDRMHQMEDRMHQMGDRMTQLENSCRKHEQEIMELKADVKVLNGKVDGLNIRLNFFFALIGLLVALELIPVVRAFTG